MSCPERDADLLMLAHGELDRARALGTRAHLLVCPACRARLRRYEALGGLLARNYRNPVLGVRALRRAPARAWAGFGLLAVLLTLLGWLASSSALAARAPATAPKVDCPFHAGPAPSAKTSVPPNFPRRSCD